MSPEVAFSGLQPVYERFEDVTFSLVNVSVSPVFSDFALLEPFGVLRYNSDRATWEELDAYRCGNALAGNSAPLKVGEPWTMAIGDYAWFLADHHPGQVKTADGALRPITGMYRLVFPYSHEKQVLDNVSDVERFVAASEPFEVRPAAGSLTRP